MDNAVKYRRQIGRWRCIAALSVVAFLVTLVTLVVIVSKGGSDDDDASSATTLPCPVTKGGLLTEGDPEHPSPFHDLTLAEFERVYQFLQQEKRMNLTDPGKAQVASSSIFMMDLLLPPKRSVLGFLDRRGPPPAREARVMMFRGDKMPAVVEEYRVGPLSKPSYAELIVNSKRRNPVSFSLRPESKVEYEVIHDYLLPLLDQKVGHILKESFGGTFTDCGDRCLTYNPVMVGTELVGSETRYIWLAATYPVEYNTLHPVDFGVLLNLQGSDPSRWSLSQVWYSGAVYDSAERLAEQYATDPSIPKTRIDYVSDSPDLRSTQRLRGTPVPDPPQRPPMQMEPDGKRYSVHHRHIKYLHWDFDIRLSAFTGPQVYDIRFQGDRIAYELGMSEIAVFYSAHNPMQRIVNYVDSGALIGTHSKSLIPGVDCPEGATFLNVSFLGEGMEKATTLERAQCVFEQNTGVPLRRHLSYGREQGSFFGGMPDSVLIVRTILAIVNYDYIVDYVFHQSGAIECRTMSTGYILTSFFHPEEAPYGFRLDDNILGNVHHHMFHFKADLDIGGLSNRYETLDISEEQVQLQQISRKKYRQTKIQRQLYRTENEAVYKYNFDKPRYHIVHNERNKTRLGVPRAYRLHMAGMSKQLLTPGDSNEKSIPWARQQLAVTVQNDEEAVSSSPYAMFDSYNPVTDFNDYIDGESIVDKDLVFWITLGTHHIPHTEDMPVTPTAGSHLSFFLFPYNYFPECPSVSSRDNIRVEYATPQQPADGLKVDRSGNKESGVCGRPSLEQLVKERPDDFLQTHREFKLYK